MKLRLGVPSPALVIACIALFVALSGVSYAVATGSIDSREIKNNSIRTQDIRNSNVTGRDVAANTLGGQDIVESKLGPVPRASNADAVGGVPASEFARRNGTGPQPIPASGTPDGEPKATYEIDPLGYVHLAGQLAQAGPGTISVPKPVPSGVLPAGARPDAERQFVAARRNVLFTDPDGNKNATTVSIRPDGGIRVSGLFNDAREAPPIISLDGITFKAGG